jgi:hypothetical protein
MSRDVNAFEGEKAKLRSWDARGIFEAIIARLFQAGGALGEEKLREETGCHGKTWKRVRGELAPLFVIEEGVWRHCLVDDALAFADRKTTPINRRFWPAKCRKSNKTGARKSLFLQNRRKTPGGGRSAEAAPSAPAPRCKDRASPHAPNRAQPPDRGPAAAESPLPADWQPTPDDLLHLQRKGLNDAHIQQFVRLFCSFNRTYRHVAADWSAAWRGYVERQCSNAA